MLLSYPSWVCIGGKEGKEFVVLYKKVNSVHVSNVASPVGTKIWSLLLQIP